MRIVYSARPAMKTWTFQEKEKSTAQMLELVLTGCSLRLHSPSKEAALLNAASEGAAVSDAVHQRQAAAPMAEAVMTAQTPTPGFSGGAAARSGTKGTLCSAAAAAPTVLHCCHMSSVMHVDSASCAPPGLRPPMLLHPTRLSATGWPDSMQPARCRHSAETAQEYASSAQEEGWRSRSTCMH